MKRHLVIDYSTEDILVNNGFTVNENRLFFKDISIKRGKNLEISKACFSQSPLFYSLMDNCFYASTSWKDLVSLLRDYKLSINLNYVYDYIQFQCPLTFETLCDQIFYLRSGETLNIYNAGRISRYFRSPAHSPHKSFRKELENLLAKLDIDNFVFHISSGLDSSLLAILASRLHSTSIRLVTCSTRGRGASDEIQCVRRLARDLKADLEIHDFTTIPIFEKGAALVEALGFPIAHPSHLMELLLDENYKKIKNIITGRGPDEALAGYDWHTEKFSSPGEHFHRVCVTKPEILSQLLILKDFSLSPDKYLFWENHSRLTLKDRLLYDSRTICQAWDIIHEGIGNYLNIDIKSPFMDKQLQHILFFLDDNLKIRDGINKWYMRETFKEFYPDYILNAPKRGLRIDLQPYLTDYSFSRLFDILYTSSEFSQKYIDKPFLEKIINETLNGNRNWGWQLWSIYLCSLSYSNIKPGRSESSNE